MAFATSGPGATNLVTPICRRDDGLGAGGLHHRPGAHGAARHRRLPGGGHARHHDAGRQALLHDPAPAGDPARDPRGLPHRAQRPSGPDRSSTSRRTSRARRSTTSRCTDVRLPGYQPTLEGNQKQIRQAANALAASQRPVIYAGGGVVNANAAPELRRARHRATAFPVTCTLMGLGALPRRPTRSGSGCSACTARAPRTTRWTRPT